MNAIQTISCIIAVAAVAVTFISLVVAVATSKRPNVETDSYSIVKSNI